MTTRLNLYVVYIEGWDYHVHAIDHDSAINSRLIYMETLPITLVCTREGKRSWFVTELIEGF